LARAIFREGCKSVAAGMNPMDLRRGIQLGVDTVVANLTKMSKDCKTKEEIHNVATISANGDEHIGSILSGIFAKLGPGATITVQDGKTLKTEVEYVEGLRWDRGFISPYFINETKQSKVVMENPYILLIDRKVSSV
jgi:chaperonin GroEL